MTVIVNKTYVQQFETRSLENLEKNLADQKAMVSSLQQKWMSTKDSLATALSTIAFLNSTQKELMESLEMSQSEHYSLKFKHFEREEKLSESHASVVSKLETRYSETLHRVEMEVTTQNAVIREKEDTIFQLRSENELLSSSLDDVQGKLDNNIAYHEQYKSETDENIVGWKRKYDDDISKEKEQSGLRISELQVEHEKALSEEMQRIRAMQSDLDEERIKRRKVEREKKFHEAEAHRYKVRY